MTNREFVEVLRKAINENIENIEKVCREDDLHEGMVIGLRKALASIDCELVIVEREG